MSNSNHCQGNTLNEFPGECSQWVTSEAVPISHSGYLRFMGFIV
jgi:hypothetical protein